MRRQPILLVFLIMLFIPLVCLDFAYAETPARLEIERIQRKFQARWHGVHPAQDYGNNSYVTWPQKSGTNTATPSFPADGYYGALIDDQQVALVRDLAEKFWASKCLNSYYVKAIVGLPNIQCFTAADMPDISNAIVDKSSAHQVLQVIDGYLDQYRFMQLGSNHKSIIKTSYSYTSVSGLLNWQILQMLASVQMTNNNLYCPMYMNAYDSDEIPSSILDPVRYEMTSDLMTYEWTDFLDNRSGCEGWRINGQISFNVGDYDAYSAVCYLKGSSLLIRQIRSQFDPASIDENHYEIDALGYSPDVAIVGDGLYWAWAWTTDGDNNAVTEITDTSWVSPNIFTSSTTMFLQDVQTHHYTYNGTTYAFGGSEGVWRLTGNEVILKLRFADDDEN